MTDYKDVHDLLSYLQKTLDVPKTHYNKFGEFYYRNNEDILNAVKKLLPEGATIKQSDKLITTDKEAYIESKSILRYKGEETDASSIAREEESRPKMAAPQLTGAASSYARKYSANGLFALDDVQDNDTMENKKVVKSQVGKKEYPKDDKPWLSEFQKNEMIKAAKDGWVELVEGRMKGYNMKNVFKDEILKAIEEGKKHPDRDKDADINF